MIKISNKTNNLVVGIICVVLSVLSSMILFGCSEEKQEEEIIITDFTYGEPEYGYFTSNEIEYNYIGSEGNSIVFESTDLNAIVQLTDLSKLLVNENSDTNESITNKDKQNALSNIVNQFKSKEYNVTQKNNIYTIKVLGEELLNKYKNLYLEISKNIKDPAVYIAINDKLDMITVFADSSTSYNLLSTFSNSGDSYIDIDLEEKKENISYTDINIEEVNNYVEEMSKVSIEEDNNKTKK